MFVIAATKLVMFEVVVMLPLLMTPKFCVLLVRLTLCIVAPAKLNSGRSRVRPLSLMRTEINSTELSVLMCTPGLGSVVCVVRVPLIRNCTREMGALFCPGSTTTVVWLKAAEVVSRSSNNANQPQKSALYRRLHGREGSEVLLAGRKGTRKIDTMD